MLTRAKLGADRIFLRQREGFLAANPAGDNVFGILYERVLPASSAANLFPFNYSGKNDPHGFYIGKDRYGSNIIVDLDRRAEDKTNANVLILGNSGQGKSFLLKLQLCNIIASGKSVICLVAYPVFFHALALNASNAGPIAPQGLFCIDCSFVSYRAV